MSRKWEQSHSDQQIMISNAPRKISFRSRNTRTTDHANLSFLIPYISKREPLPYNAWQSICQVLKTIYAK